MVPQTAERVALARRAEAPGSEQGEQGGHAGDLLRPWPTEGSTARRCDRWGGCQSVQLAAPLPVRLDPRETFRRRLGRLKRYLAADFARRP
jgi:hypothetical protein